MGGGQRTIAAHPQRPCAKCVTSNLKRQVSILISPILIFCSALSSQPKRLTLDDIFAWKHVYDVLGKDEAKTYELLGEPDEVKVQGYAGHLRWKPSEKTMWRAIWIVASKDSRGIVHMDQIRIFSKDHWPLLPDDLDVTEILKKAELFDFESGVFNNSTNAYFRALTKDHKTTFLFTVDRNK